MKFHWLFWIVLLDVLAGHLKAHDENLEEAQVLCTLLQLSEAKPSPPFQLTDVERTLSEISLYNLSVSEEGFYKLIETEKPFQEVQKTNPQIGEDWGTLWDGWVSAKKLLESKGEDRGVRRLAGIHLAQVTRERMKRVANTAMTIVGEIRSKLKLFNDTKIEEEMRIGVYGKNNDEVAADGAGILPSSSNRASACDGTASGAKNNLVTNLLCVCADGYDSSSELAQYACFGNSNAILWAGTSGDTVASKTKTAWEQIKQECVKLVGAQKLTARAIRHSLEKFRDLVLLDHAAESNKNRKRGYLGIVHTKGSTSTCDGQSGANYGKCVKYTVADVLGPKFSKLPWAAKFEEAARQIETLEEVEDGLRDKYSRLKHLEHQAVDLYTLALHAKEPTYPEASKNVTSGTLSQIQRDGEPKIVSLANGAHNKFHIALKTVFLIVY